MGQLRLIHLKAEGIELGRRDDDTLRYLLEMNRGVLAWFKRTS